MATLKMKKLPKAPKQSASVKVKENWVKRALAIKKENARRAQENKRSETLTKRINAIRGL